MPQGFGECRLAKLCWLSCVWKASSTGAASYLPKRRRNHVPFQPDRVAVSAVDVAHKHVDVRARAALRQADDLVESLRGKGEQQHANGERECSPREGRVHGAWVYATFTVEAQHSCVKVCSSSYRA